MKVVTVHRGARDAYQVGLALSEAGLLDRLVTDLYWPADRPWASLAERLVGSRATQALKARYRPGLASRNVRLCSGSGLASFALGKLPGPFSWKRRSTRWTDTCLGREAGRLATRNSSALLSYSYYAHSAFSNVPNTLPRILFQLHPHPVSTRRILSQELRDHPDCADSLQKEWELALTEEDFLRLGAETAMAQHWIAASSFTRRTLAENGVPNHKIHVAPYGVDLEHFTPAGDRPRASSSPLRLLFVGTITQRKGIKYLVEAMRHFPGRHVELIVCGRPVDDLRMFEPFGSQIQVRVSVSAKELLEAYRHSDLFVFPSVAEGFGQVLLESLACGLPVLSTTHTAAPDLIDEGQDGFVVPPRRVDLLAERIEWALTHRPALAAMSSAARRKAEQFTWDRFRRSIAFSVQSILDGATVNAVEETATHV